MMEDAVWHAWMPEQSEPGFPVDIAHVALFTTVVDADSDLAAELLADPLPHLAKKLEGVSEDWTVSVNRLNAERTLKGPRKLTFVWMAIYELEMVQGMAYRTPQPSEGIASQD
jgi:hypothetical protein